MTRLSRILPAGLLLVALALGGVIASELGAGSPDARDEPSQNRVAVTSAETPARPAPPPDRTRTWLNTILARPLFSPDRRPVEVGVRGLPRLTGIMLAGSQQVAIFAAASGDHPIVAQVGAHVGAYEVQSIADTGVTVVGPEGVTMIRPSFDVARTPGPPSAGLTPRGLPGRTGGK